MSELKPIAPALSQRALTQSKKPSDREALQASQAARKILSSYPDYGKAPPEYLLSITEYLAYLPAEDQEALAHPISGISSKTTFLPTKKDMADFLAERHKRLNTLATGYSYLRAGEDDPVNIPPGERRKAQVLAELGYDPSITRDSRAVRKPLEPAIIDAIEEGSWSSSSLKTAQKPISPELRSLLIEQGVLQPATSEAEAA